MTVLSAQSIRSCAEFGQRHPQHQGALRIEPFEWESKQACGMSYGVTAAGYDIRIGKLQSPERFPADVQSWLLQPGQFMLAASFEFMKIPDYLQAIVHDKSTLARQGIALQNTVLEPGWEGYITLELSNHGPKPIRILKGQPIAQVVFHRLDERTVLPYTGKYQNQSDNPTQAILVHEGVDGDLHGPDEDFINAK